MRKALIIPFIVVPIMLIGSSTAKSEPNQQMVLQELTPVLAEVNIPVSVSPVREVPPIRLELLKAAKAQLGIAQDCTDLVQNSLAALGLTIRRDGGGLDMGVRSFTAFGKVIPASEASPGDIVFIGPSNGGHVWIVANPKTNEGVHGGWNGSTVLGNNHVPISTHTVIRVAI